MKRQSSGYLKPPVESIDIPAPLHTFQYSSSSDGCDSNILILFHGMGDKSAPMFKFAQNMKLPQTAILSLQAPIPIMDFGYVWYDSFDEEGELIPPSLNRYHSLQNVREGLISLIEDTLIGSFGWERERIFLFGFSQGASVALDTVLHGRGRLGGLVGISGGLVDEEMLPNITVDPINSSAALQTPMIFTHGQKDTMVPLAKAREKFNCLKSKVPNHSKLNMFEFPKTHDMVNSPEEMRVIMKFFASTLYLRALGIEQMPGVVEIK